KASPEQDAGSGGAVNGKAADSATDTAGSGGSPAASSGTGASDDNGSDSGSGDGSAPAVSTYKGSPKFSIGLPKGWKYTRTDSAGARFTGPDGQKLLVAWTSTPKDDPVADWRDQERYMVRKQYHRIRIEKVGYRGWNAADWEFTYLDGGTRYRTIDRGFVVDDRHGYALMYTAKADNWGSDLRRDTWRTLTKTFEPK
ncbi:serine/threonine protein kinase, partial [Streptomyces carpinensis]